MQYTEFFNCKIEKKIIRKIVDISNIFLKTFIVDLLNEYLHFSKTSLDEPIDVHLCSYFHELHCVTLRDVIQT